MEQNIHIIDLFNWMLGTRPLKATATGGRNILTHAGDCWDNYQVDYTYPDGHPLRLCLNAVRQLQRFDAGLRIFGEAGAATLAYSGPVKISGAQAWEWKDATNRPPPIPASSRPTESFGQSGLRRPGKGAAVYRQHHTGPAHNQIADGVNTGSSCLLGRMAGYHRREVTWEELLAKGESYPLGINLEQFA